MDGNTFGCPKRESGRNSYSRSRVGDPWRIARKIIIADFRPTSCAACDINRLVVSNMTGLSMQNHNQAVEELVPRPRVAREYNVSTRTIFRWEQAGLPGVDEPVVINRRVYYRQSRLEAAKRAATSEAAE